jgi:hypothetical protein
LGVGLVFLFAQDIGMEWTQQPTDCVFKHATTIIGEMLKRVCATM